MLNEKYQALLDQYDISVSHTRRGRGCVLCFGENDVYALSQTSLSEERLGAVSEWTLAMHDHHFYKTDQYILNKDGYFLTFIRGITKHLRLEKLIWVRNVIFML